MSPLWRIATPGAGAIHSINGATMAYPIQQLQSIRLLGAENKDGSGERILVQLVLDHRGQAVIALAEVGGLGCHHDPHPV